MSPRLSVTVERFPVAGAFTIARGSRTEAVVVVATIDDGTHRGRGECVPYPRYGESVEGVVAAIEAVGPHLPDLLRPSGDVGALMAPGAARNAVDCALWDLAAKRSGIPVAERLGLTPHPVVTCFTISLGTPEVMAAATAKAAGRPLLKIKLGGDGDVDRIRAVRAAAPAARLVVDANESWRPSNLAANLAACAAAGVELVEQPLPAGDDDALLTIAHTIPVCADESLHTSGDLSALVGRYDAINIKLDKTGGLTEALRLKTAARAAGFKVMVGCMLATSLGMAPAFYVAQDADVVDIDGPLLLAADRDTPMTYRGSSVDAPPAALWG
jgi:L-alanine-DL-glutamate epimerase-like enolase superfamily enzyme